MRAKTWERIGYISLTGITASLGLAIYYTNVPDLIPATLGYISFIVFFVLAFVAVYRAEVNT